MVDLKPWHQSKTIWGALVAAAASVSGAMGLDLDPAAGIELSQIHVQLVGAAGALLAVYGRLTATDAIAV